LLPLLLPLRLLLLRPTPAPKPARRKLSSPLPLRPRLPPPPTIPSRSADRLPAILREDIAPPAPRELSDLPNPPEYDCDTSGWFPARLSSSSMEDTRERAGPLAIEKDVERSPEKAPPGLSLMRADSGRLPSWKNSSGVSFGDCSTDATGAGRC
ncbi:unnamed protein product, partial [Ectocarpus sp. 8 AP-2014]